MRAAAGSQLDRGVDLTGPHSRRIDHHAGGQFECLPRQLVGQLHRTAGGRGGRHPGQDPGAVLRGSACHRGNQPGVVDELPVVGQQRAVEPVAADGRGHLDRLLHTDPTGPRQGRGLGAREHAQPVAGDESYSNQSSLGAAHGRQQRNQLRHGVHQMGSVAGHQDAALHSAAPRDADVARGQIAQTAVHELGTPPAGAERQIVLLDQHDRQSATGGVQGDPGSGDATADDDDVDASDVPEFGQVAGPAGGVEGGEVAHGARYPFSA